MLVAGGEAMVRGGVSVAKKLNVPVMIIGLTFVSVGTSAPEMLVSINAALGDHPDIAIGNVLGSNVANILLVLGAAALVFPIVCDAKVVKREMAVLLAVTALFTLYAYQWGVIGRLQGGCFLLILGYYLYEMVRNTKAAPDPEFLEELEEEASFEYSWVISCVLLAFGIGLLVWGADLLVGNASILARSFGISEGVIAITIVAIGTSAPELITSVMAAVRQQNDLAVGNVIGSNLFNILAVLGAAGVVAPMAVSDAFLHVDIWVMIAATLLLIPLMLSGGRISRKEGGLLLAAYFGYMAYQAMQL